MQKKVNTERIAKTNEYISDQFVLVNDVDDTKRAFISRNNIDKLLDWQKTNFIGLTPPEWRFLLRNNSLLFNNVRFCYELIKLETKYDFITEIYDSFLSIQDENIDLDRILNSLNYSVNTYGKAISRIPILTIEQENELAVRVANKDEKARKQMILFNLRMAYSYARSLASSNLAIEDLIQECNVGIIKAVDSYDVTKNTRFSTYASFWMRLYASRYFAKMHIGVSLPWHEHVKFNKIDSMIYSISNNLGRYPTDEELVEILGVSKYDITAFHNFGHELISLNKNVDGTDTEYGTMVSSDDTRLDELVFKEGLKQELQRILNSTELTTKEMEFIALHYGLFDDKPRTLKEIGKIYGFTREGVRKVVDKALTKILLNENADSLLIFSNNPEKAKEYLTRKRKEYFYTPKRCNICIERILDYVKEGIVINYNSFSFEQQEVFDLIKNGAKAKQILEKLDIYIEDLYTILNDIILVYKKGKSRVLRKQ